MQRMTSTAPRSDGSAGDADYGAIGLVYRDFRVADPRIAAVVHAALGTARRVLNIGAGTGSYEPTDRVVTPVEPSATMRSRRSSHLPPAIDASAESLPFADRSFDAAMGTFTVHQWKERAKGLAEVRRVTRGPVVLLTCDPTQLRTWWLHEYAPDVVDVEASRYPPIDVLAAELCGRTTATPVAIPGDCTDGFNDAYFARPEMLLDPQARLACSAWSFVDRSVVERFEERLRRDLADGTWDAKHGDWRTRDALVGPLVLVVSQPID
jgi:SAM-dependent methyltransferase